MIIIIKWYECQDPRMLGARCIAAGVADTPTRRCVKIQADQDTAGLHL